MSDILKILQDASPPFLLLAIVVLGLMVKRLAANAERMREAESKRNADHMEIMSKRMNELDRNDVRRQMSMSDGVERFKQLVEADQANANALVAVSREFVRVETCRDCQARTKEDRDRSDRVQDRFTEKLEAIELGQVELKQDMKQGLATLTRLLSNVVTVGGTKG